MHLLFLIVPPAGAVTPAESKYFCEIVPGKTDKPLPMHRRYKGVPGAGRVRTATTGHNRVTSHSTLLTMRPRNPGNSTMRRFLLFFSAFAAFSAAAGNVEAQYEAPNYSIERWDEDYSYLKDPSSRTDPFDSLKYIPIGDRGDWYLSLGGQARVRYDYFNNAGFGEGAQSEQGFELVRLLAHVDAHFGPNLRAFLQFNSGLEYDRRGDAGSEMWMISTFNRHLLTSIFPCRTKNRCCCALDGRS